VHAAGLKCVNTSKTAAQAAANDLKLERQEAREGENAVNDNAESSSVVDRPPTLYARRRSKDMTKSGIGSFCEFPSRGRQPRSENRVRRCYQFKLSHYPKSVMSQFEVIFPVNVPCPSAQAVSPSPDDGQRDRSAQSPFGN
jgi:hypothetical protein